MSMNIHAPGELVGGASRDVAVHVLHHLAVALREDRALAHDARHCESFIRALLSLGALRSGTAVCGVLGAEQTPDGPSTGFGPEWYGPTTFNRLHAVSHLGADLQLVDLERS